MCTCTLISAYVDINVQIGNKTMNGTKNVRDYNQEKRLIKVNSPNLLNVVKYSNEIFAFHNELVIGPSNISKTYDLFFLLC